MTHDTNGGAFSGSQATASVDASTPQDSQVGYWDYASAWDVFTAPYDSVVDTVSPLLPWNAAQTVADIAIDKTGSIKDNVLDAVDDAKILVAGIDDTIADALSAAKGLALIAVGTTVVGALLVGGVYVYSTQKAPNVSRSRRRY